MKPLVLQYGHEARLLDTRGWVLESAGFAVRSAADRAEACRVLAAEPIAALILCHTLSFAEREEILAAAHARKPGLRSVILNANGSGHAGDGSDLVLRNLAGAGALIGAVRQAAQQVVQPA